MVSGSGVSAMSPRTPFAISATRPVIVGTGLVALDVVIEAESREEPWLWTGGTCGNVLTILGYLGWRSIPVARLNGDAASRCVEADLERWGVCLDFARVAPGSRTPIIIHRIGKTAAGVPTHRFSWTCPNCGAWLPGYQPVVASAARSILENLGRPKVFFMDRVSPAALVLAQAAAAKGALVCFEPSGSGEPRLLKEAFGIAHVVKYSHERVRSLHGSGVRPSALLEIETLGDEGLRFRSSLPSARTNGWKRLKPFDVVEVRDAAGAGDWCTAGVLHTLGQRGVVGLQRVRLPRVEEALRFGQALAAWNCGFAGARGGMYAVEKRVFCLQVQGILEQEGKQSTRREVPSASVREAFQCICPTCAAGKG